jgi:hypothetical protein
MAQSSSGIYICTETEGYDYCADEIESREAMVSQQSSSDAIGYNHSLLTAKIKEAV